jgi:hypothetical protein
VVEHNVSHKDKSYQSGDSAGTVVQSFEREPTERLIAEQPWSNQEATVEVEG